MRERGWIDLEKSYMLYTEKGKKVFMEFWTRHQATSNFWKGNQTFGTRNIITIQCKTVGSVYK